MLVPVGVGVRVRKEPQNRTFFRTGGMAGEIVETGASEPLAAHTRKKLRFFL